MYKWIRSYRTIDYQWMEIIVQMIDGDGDIIAIHPETYDGLDMNKIEHYGVPLRLWARVSDDLDRRIVKRLEGHIRFKEDKDGLR